MFELNPSNGTQFDQFKFSQVYNIYREILIKHDNIY